MLRLAEHTVSAIRSAGLHVVVVSSDSAVTAWGAAHAKQVVPEPSVGGLDAAALAGVSAVPGPWMVVHADLPALTVGDMVAAAQLADRTTVIAPSRDGGTSLIGSNGDPQPFRYGPGSFRRHLSRYSRTGDHPRTSRPRPRPRSPLGSGCAPPPRLPVSGKQPKPSLGISDRAKVAAGRICSQCHPDSTTRSRTRRTRCPHLRSVMTIGAHPDDAEFGAGATLFRWTADGAEATIVIVTDGSKGSWDPRIDDADLVAQRRQRTDVCRGRPRSAQCRVARPARR